MTRPLQIAVVSPFLDKRHGTERCVTEQVERLARNHGCEVTLYSQAVADITVCDGHKPFRKNSLDGWISWRRVPTVPGPHLIRFASWFVANHIVRWWDRLAGKFIPDLVYSPGINCLDADVISVHIVFAEFRSRVRAELALLSNPPCSWLRLIHRRIYYRLIMFLERLVYRSDRVFLTGVSNKVAEDVRRIYGREKNLGVIYHGVDGRQFNPQVLASLRCSARREFGLPDSAFVLLLVGNDLKKKGLFTLLKAMARLHDPSIWALIVGKDDSAPFRPLLECGNLPVLFLPMRPDVERYYATANAYVGPSLEDAFALPPLEAMACGVPAVVSRQAGVSELITHGVDGLILENPTDPDELARCISKLVSDRQFHLRLAENALETARKYTWEKNAEELFGLFLETNMGRAE